MKQTRFEKARILGARAPQIALGAPFLVKLSEEELENIKYNPIEIAKIEMAKDLIPITIRKHVH